MRRLFFFFLTAVLSFLLTSCSFSEKPVVQSPDGNIRIQFRLIKGIPYYSVIRLERVILSDSRLGFIFKDKAPLNHNFKIENVLYRSCDTTWTQPWGEVKDIRNRYNEMTVRLQEKHAPHRKMDVIFRAFDDGIGFRYEIPQQAALDSFQITDELTEFNLTEDPRCWWIGAYQRNRYEYLFQETRLSEIDTVHTPFTMETDDGLCLSIYEANLTDYSSMALARYDSTNLTCDLCPWSDGTKVKAHTPMVTPWRTMQIAEKPGDLITSYLILNLNEPSKIKDTSWIYPQKYIGIWWEMHIGKSTWGSGEKHGATTANVKKYIDFAAKQGFDGVLVEGWNVDWDGDWSQNGSIFNFTQPHPDYDIDKLSEYAKEKGVRIIGHHETSADILNYESQMENAFNFCNKYGINTVKTGYVGHGRAVMRIDENGNVQKEWHHGQYMVRHYRKVVETAAKYHIMLDVHEPIKDTGIRRTWPNMMTREDARGMEYNAWSPDGGNPPNYMTILPFTRLLSGPMDFTPGIVDLFYPEYRPDNRINATLAKMLSYYVVVYSPLQMAADLPENYEEHPDVFQFIRNVPVDWEYTKVLNAEIGKYLTIARKDRHSDDWYLGSVTNEDDRIFKINLDFLDKDKIYTAEIYEDGADTDWKDNPTDIRIYQKFHVTSKTPMTLSLAPGGGAAIRFTPMTQNEQEGYDENGPIREFHHPNPAKLVQGYLKRDAHGDFMRSNSWNSSSMMHPIQPGWDSATMISGYKIDTVYVKSDEALYNVTYDVIAPVSQNSKGFVITINPQPKTIRFILKNTQWGWRIEEPNQHPFILPETIVNRLSEDDQKKLKIYLENKT